MYLCRGQCDTTGRCFRDPRDSASRHHPASFGAPKFPFPGRLLCCKRTVRISRTSPVEDRSPVHGASLPRAPDHGSYLQHLIHVHLSGRIDQLDFSRPMCYTGLPFRQADVGADLIPERLAIKGVQRFRVHQLPQLVDHRPDSPSFWVVQKDVVPTPVMDAQWGVPH